MKLIATLSITLLLAACTLSNRDTESSQSSPAGVYAVEIVCDRMIGEEVVLLAAPKLLVRQGESSSVSLQDAEGVYTFRVNVEEQKGRLVATTMASIDHVEAGESSPTLVQFVGESANVRAGELRVSVAVGPSQPS